MYCKFEDGANCKISWNWPLTSYLHFVGTHIMYSQFLVVYVLFVIY